MSLDLATVARMAAAGRGGAAPAAPEPPYNIVVVTYQTTNASATNTKAALEAKGHTVTLATDADMRAGSIVWDNYDVIVCTRLLMSDGAGNATALRARLAAGQPVVMDCMGSGSAGLAQTAPAVVSMEVCDSVDIEASVADQTDVSDTNHPVTVAFAAGLLTVRSSANWAGAMNGVAASGQVLTLGEAGTIAGDAQTVAFEATDTDQLGVEFGARLVVTFTYAGQSAYTADGETLLDRCVQWATGYLNEVPFGTVRLGRLSNEVLVQGSAVRLGRASVEALAQGEAVRVGRASVEVLTTQ